MVKKTYNPLIYVIKKQVVDGRRRKEPQFTPAATTSGELGPGCVVVQEWLAMRYKAHLTRAGDRADGRKAAQLTGKFRADFRMALLMVAARRAASVQQGAGLPSCCVRGDVLDVPPASA